MNAAFVPGSDNTIPEQEAIDITTNYRNYMSGIDPDPNYIRAFNVPMTDIQELAQFTKSPSVRIYLTMTVPNDTSSLKIILVPVDENNKDILSIPVADSTGNGSTEQSTIYDFSSPCPQNCDVDSPLFQ